MTINATIVLLQGLCKQKRDDFCFTRSWYYSMMHIYFLFPPLEMLRIVYLFAEETVSQGRSLSRCLNYITTFHHRVKGGNHARHENYFIHSQRYRSRPGSRNFPLTCHESGSWKKKEKNDPVSCYKFQLFQIYCLSKAIMMMISWNIMKNWSMGIVQFF